MSTRLRNWATTGEYSEGPEVLPVPSHARRFPGAGRLEGAAVAALVPIGILVGALLALAFVVRLLMLPLGLGTGSGPGREQ